MEKYYTIEKRGQGLTESDDEKMKSRDGEKRMERPKERKKRGKGMGWMMAGWLILLGMMSVVLLWNAETGSVGYWIRTGAVAGGWVVFLLLFTPMRVFADLRVTEAGVDKVIIMFLLLLFFTISIWMFVGSVRGGNLGTALLFGIMGWGIFNVMRELAKRREKRNRR
jgi:cation transport ATPase